MCCTNTWTKQGKRILERVQRYFQAIQKDGMIHPSGALSGGWCTAEGRSDSGPILGEDNVSTSLTGGEIFAWMYHITKDDQYRQLAFKPLRWSFGHDEPRRSHPVMYAPEGADLTKKGDSLNDYHLWDALPYCTSSYVGEGLIAFDLYSDQPEWRAELRKAIKPHIQFAAAHTERQTEAGGSFNRRGRPCARARWT